MFVGRGRRRGDLRRLDPLPGARGSFATLQGGATLPEWRSRGVYRALVARRAVLAAERGCEYLQVDASDDSRPILERLGFVADRDDDAVPLVAASPRLSS